MKLSQCLAYDPVHGKNLWIRCAEDRICKSVYCKSHTIAIAKCAPVPIMAFPVKLGELIG